MIFAISTSTWQTFVLYSQRCYYVEVRFQSYLPLSQCFFGPFNYEQSPNRTANKLKVSISLWFRLTIKSIFHPFTLVRLSLRTGRPPFPFNTHSYLVFEALYFNSSLGKLTGRHSGGMSCFIPLTLNFVKYYCISLEIASFKINIVVFLFCYWLLHI